jgi:hypothetical protein
VRPLPVAFVISPVGRRPRRPEKGDPPLSPTGIDQRPDRRGRALMVRRLLLLAGIILAAAYLARVASLGGEL